MKNKHKRAPNGYRILTKIQKVSNFFYGSSSLKGDDCRCVHVGLYSSRDFCDIELGYVDVVKTRYGFWETHAYLNDSERSMGLGAMLYARAIRYCLDRGYVVKSSTAPTDAAKRTWKSRRLNNEFVIKRVHKRFVVLGKR